MSRLDQMRDDVRGTCIHEFGHATVAGALGIGGNVKLYRPEGKEPGLKFLVGHFEWNEKPDPSRMRPIALAGALAEEIDICGPLALPGPRLLMAQFRSGQMRMSNSDARMAGLFTTDDIVEAVQLLGLNWNVVTAHATREAASWERYIR